MATGSIFQFSGLSSGFNTDTILSKMLEVEKAPISRFQSRQAQITKEQTSWRSINTRMLALGTAAEKLQSADLFTQRSATSSQPEVLGVSAQPGQDLGSYTFSVEALARSHQAISQGYSTADAQVGTGTVTLSVGSAGFPPITLTSGKSSLQDLRDAINGANLGVSASILDAGEAAGGDRFRLMLTSQTTGLLGRMTVDFQLDGATEPQLADLVAAQDAHVKLGQGAAAVDIYSSRNTISGALAGVTLDLKAAKPGTAVEVRLNRSTSGMRAAVENFVSQYNALSDSFNAEFAYDKESGVGGTLLGNPTLISLQQDLFSRVTSSRQVGGSFNALTAVGINVDDKGKLSISDSLAFERALDRPDDLRKLFADPEQGVSANLRSLVDKATRSGDGILTMEDQRLSGHYEELDDRISDVQARVGRSEQRLRKMFLAMEEAMARLKTQSSVLAASLASLTPNSSSGNSNSQKSGG